MAPPAAATTPVSDDGHPTETSATTLAMSDQENESGLIPVDRYWIQKLIQKAKQQQQQQKQQQPQDDGDSNKDMQEIKALVVAPMVDQSDLPFRLLCRKYGANLAFTPMVHCRLLVTSPEYRAKFVPQVQCLEDRPLIAQLCGSEPHIVEQAAKILCPYVDGIDINCGCPQNIAKRGNYGAFLLEQEDLLVPLVRHLVRTVPKPISVKVRLLPDADASNNNLTIAEEASLQLYHKLVNAGIHLLTIHGRTRFHKGHLTGAANWKIIQRAVHELGDRIPIFANGSIANMDQVDDCIQATGVDGVMSSEALLEYPALFASQDQRMGRLQLAREYLQWAKAYPPQKGGQGSGAKCLRAHVHRILHADLEQDFSMRQRVAEADKVEEFEAELDILEKRHKECQHAVQEEHLSWYMRHRNMVMDDNTGEMVSTSQLQHEQNSKVKSVELAEDTAEIFSCLFADDHYYEQ